MADKPSQRASTIPMLPLTKQERLVLFVLGVIIFTGQAALIIQKRLPFIWDMVNAAQSSHFTVKTDLNKADYDQLVAVPGIGPYTAERILKYREASGCFQSLDDLKHVDGIKEKRIQGILPYLTVTHGKKTCS